MRRYNDAYDRIKKNADHIDEVYPESVHLLTDLMTHPDVLVFSHLAPIVLHLHNSTVEQKREALSVISALTRDPRLDEIERLGFSMSLILFSN